MDDSELSDHEIGDDVAPRSLPLLTDTSIRDIDKGRVCTIGRNEVPTMQQLQKIKGKDNKMIRIMTSVSPDWEDVAISMGFEAHTIGTIRRDNVHDSKAATRQLFMLWLEGRRKSWEVLVEILDDAGFTVIASDLQEMFA